LVKSVFLSLLISLSVLRLCRSNEGSSLFRVRSFIGAHSFYFAEEWEMANSKELMALAKKLGQAAVAIGPVVALAEPVADWAKDKIDERGELIEVPRLYSKGFPVSLSDGVATVTAAGLTVTTSKLPLSAAHAKYRNCADQQIVKSDPPQGRKVRAKSNVVLSYITEDVISESRRKFEEEQRQKALIKEERAVKAAARKQAAVETCEKLKDNVLQAMKRKEKS
jgi:hypothetical protein